VIKTLDLERLPGEFSALHSIGFNEMKLQRHFYIVVESVFTAPLTLHTRPPNRSRAITWEKRK
jgi:hypothetical protein